MTTAAIDHPLHLRSPAYYAPDDGNSQDVRKHSLVTRAFYAVLPFIALHKPFGRIITLTMDSSRTVSSFSQLLEKKDGKAALKTIIAIAALAGTVFMHPLGLCIATLYDLISNLPEAITQLQAGNLQGLILTFQHGLYLGTILIGSVEIIAISLLLSMAIEIYRSRKEFQQGYLLEGISHLLMSIVRFGQSVPYMARAAEQNNLRSQQLFKSLETTAAKVRDRAALFFYSSARSLVTPLWKSTSVWLKTISDCKNPLSSTSQKISSVAKSALLSCVLLPLTFSGLALGQVLHFTAFNLATTPYIHLTGDAEIQNPSDKKFSMFQLNCCLTAGGFARLFGGLDLSDEQRVEEIAKMIRANNPDIACLQEVSDLEDALSLYRKLSPEFAEFYLNIGATPFILQNNSGLFVASKQAITNPQFHSFADIQGTESMVNKGYFSFSTPVANFINTHLSPSSDDLHPTDPEIRTRAKEQRRILDTAQDQFSNNNKPVFVSGDCNTDQGLLFDQCTDRSTPNPQATCEADYLVDRNWRHDSSAQPRGKMIDYFFSFFQKPPTFNTRTIPTFNVDRPKDAISDHPALFSEVTLS
ncbi:MAG: endonuclease/exonuclease/phosphatase family protein [Chlamydiales bacterium]|nr:endonuclease/exonuclease/phosphatase family protein [Chlamydiales bacterium]